MTYRVEISARAENDAEEILEWLLARHAGETGLRWFSAMEDAITSLATFPERCPLAPESTQSRLRCVNSSTAISRTCTEFCSPFRKAQSTSFISVTVGASQLRDVRQAHFSQRTREMGHPAHPTDAPFWKNAKVVMPSPKTIVTMRLDTDLLRWFRQQRGYQTRINAILRAYMEAQATI